jgi:hypothetical protein
MKLAALAVLLAGCGSSTPATAPVGPPASIVATDPTPVVAHVNGRPVYASCVEAQGTAHHLAARAALDECIAFELMAQEADRRGLARDHEVVLATKRALVSRVLQLEFEDGLQDPAAFGDAWPQFLKKYDWHVRHGEYRASAYVRIPVAAGAPPDADAKAHELADRIATTLAPERGLLGDHLRAIAENITGPLTRPCAKETTVPCWDSLDAYRVDGLEAAYGQALFAIREPGRATGAVRTEWGWDVIVWTEDVPAAAPTQAELERKMLPEFKQWYLGVWAHAIELDLHVKIERAPDAAQLIGSQL